MLQHKVCEHPRPGALQSVPVGILAEDGVHILSYVVTDLPQCWVPRGGCKHPLQHLAGAGIVPVSCNLRSGKLVLPPSQQRVPGLDDVIHCTPAFCVHVSIQAAHSQDDHVPEEV